MAKLQKKSIANRQEIRAILSETWGYEKFRPLQEEIILSVLSGKDTLALMPTGGGKSLTFQIPALAMDGICLVITPLIALMKDQVDQLRAKGVKALAIHSGMNQHEIDVALNNCVFGDYKFLYVSPERIRTTLFKTRVSDMQVNLLAVDEAHCISQWGYDFRPSYLEIDSLRSLLNKVPVLALTATATPEVCEDIQERLGFPEKNLMQKSFNRENLAYQVIRTEDKFRELREILHASPGCSIVYTRNRKKCRELAEMLQNNGITASYYHAGLKPSERDERQKQWTTNVFRVMVATNAFGMGIDKADVRFVVHMDLPDGPEAYFQEAGRAGRDGKYSRALLLYNEVDRRLVEQRIDTSFPSVSTIREIYRALGNFLQIPVGGGKGHSYDFEFGEFLHRYRYNALLANSVIQILGQEAYLSITDAFRNPARIKFIVNRDELYRFQLSNQKLDVFIGLLLRNYSGLFTQYVRFDESWLARKTELSKAQVSFYLKALSKQKIISYIPRRELPVMTYLEERLDDKNLLIEPGKYRFRKERYERRIREMLRYASTENMCRNQFLLSYFGQFDSTRCGRCDVCLKQEDLIPGSKEFMQIVASLAERLEEGPLALDELLRELPGGSARGAGVLEWMVDRGTVSRESDLRFRKKE